MEAGEIIIKVQDALTAAFGALAPWPDKDILLRGFHPGPGEWCIDEVLEHIALANRYLLLLIEKGRKKALKKSDPARLTRELDGYRLTSDRLEQVGVNNSFEWRCPGHMVPSGSRPLEEICRELDTQKKSLRDNLSLMKNGEGVLHKTSLSVNGLGRLDVYQYMYFLLQHCRRHIGQMEEIERAYNAVKYA
jgi:hypothetical protein